MHKKIAIVNISKKGSNGVADALLREISTADIVDVHDVPHLFQSADYDAYIFVSALGICVRTIAHLIEDKHSDPAVVCVDGMGKHVVSVISGHLGGANELTKTVAHILGAHPVITTLSDCLTMWTLDTVAWRFGWTISTTSINKEITLFVTGEPTALLLDIKDEGTEWMENNLPYNVTLCHDINDVDAEKYKLLIIVSPFLYDNVNIPCIQYFPKVVCLGVGLARMASPTDNVCQELIDCLKINRISQNSICSVSSVEEKKNEPALAMFCQRLSVVPTFFLSENLAEVVVPTPSDTVRKYMGTASVSEAAALLQSKGGRLIVPKQKGTNWTLAAAISHDYVREGHIEFVGAGPGAPDLISVRGRLLLEKADLILYAGSLVPEALTLCAKDGAVVRSSASMTLEQQVELMAEYYWRGKQIVRLHTGDPCLYGAIQEQMALLDKLGIHYHITPGISAFQAAAAELKSQFTIPRKTQTIILTRGEGRTPMPQLEQLHLLARSRSTMCIYLSADIVEKVEQELLMEYPSNTPVAVCYRLTWKEQRIFKGYLNDLSNIVRGNNLTLDTLIVVGEAIANREGLSELYSSHFTHLFRKATE